MSEAIAGAVRLAGACRGMAATDTAASGSGSSLSVSIAESRPSARGDVYSLSVVFSQTGYTKRRWRSFAPLVL